MNGSEYGRLRSLPARRLVQALLDDGFALSRQRGSHHRYRHPDGRRVTVPFARSGETIAQGTLRSIVERQAKWTRRDLERLGLL